ncbi:CBS domain-containing protein, partial [Methanobacterium sp.]
MEVKEAMNQGVITVNPEIKPLEAFEKMYKEGVRRLFVLDGEGNPKGVISYSDLIGVLGSLRPTNNNIAALKIS